MAIIEVSGLQKHYLVHQRAPGLGAALRSLFWRRYDTVRAVDDISFTIEAGERVGFLGPNGAGKTTTLKVLAGLLQPTGGRARVAGFEPGKRQRAFLSSIMLVTGQKQQLIWDLPPAETFELNRAIYEIPRAQYRETLDELVALLGLAPLMVKPTRQLSLGERMKCELAAALLHRPQILFLDEPTIGLDVTMQATVRAFIKTYNERSSSTILLTSHYMDDVLALCPRVIVIDRGKIIYDGGLEALAQRTLPQKRMTLRLTRQVSAADLEGVGRVISHDDTRVVVQVPQEALQPVLTRVMGQLPVADLTLEDPPLEEVLSDLFARGLREEATEARNQ